MMQHIAFVIPPGIRFFLQRGFLAHVRIGMNIFTSYDPLSV